MNYFYTSKELLILIIFNHQELVSLDSHNTIANQSESTSYEESFSNVEEDAVDSCDLKVGEEVPSSAEGERCHFESEKPTRKKRWFRTMSFAFSELLARLLLLGLLDFERFIVSGGSSSCNTSSAGIYGFITLN